MEQRYLPLSSAWSSWRSVFTADAWCALGFQQPLLAVNAVFFLNVDVLFWVIALLQVRLKRRGIARGGHGACRRCGWSWGRSIA